MAVNSGVPLRCRFKSLLGVLLFASFSFGQAASAPAGRSYARSVVASTRGIVATNQVLASQAGAEMLARGGSAVDAAIAANAALGVLEPMSSGLGGDLFAIYRDARTGAITGLNASGWAPSGLTIELLKQKGMDRMPRQGIYSVTVPGCLDGWEKLHSRFGRLPWKDLFAPAISLASSGFPVSEGIANFWNALVVPSCVDEGCRSVLLPNGTAPKSGDIFRNPDLAAALKLLSTAGAMRFYKGPMAAAILRSSNRLGGTISRADLEEFSSEWVTPISSTYRGWTVYELPPNSRGVAVLEMLNLLSTFPAEEMSAASSLMIHRRIEAMRLAYANIQYVADPRLLSVPVSGLLSSDYARRRASLIDSERANCDAKAGDPAMLPGDTTYLSVVDRDGNIVSLIQSLATGQSGVVADGMGFLLQNRGVYFSLDPSQPNALAPRKRTSHTLVPALMEKGDIHIGFGFVGGPTQVMAQMQFISNVVDLGMNVQASVDAPRFRSSKFGPGCNVLLENRVSVELREALAKKGHRIELTPEYQDGMGIGQAVVWDSRSKTKYGASDPRGDGAAIPEVPW